MPLEQDAYRPYADAEDRAFYAFIDGTNVVGGLEGYKRMVARVADMLADDTGVTLKRLAEMIEEDGKRAGGQ